MVSFKNFVIFTFISSETMAWATSTTILNNFNFFDNLITIKLLCNRFDLFFNDLIFIKYCTYFHNDSNWKIGNSHFLVQSKYFDCNYVVWSAKAKTINA